MFLVCGLFLVLGVRRKLTEVAHEVVHNCPGCQSDMREQVEGHGRELGDGDIVMDG